MAKNSENVAFLRSRNDYGLYLASCWSFLRFYTMVHAIQTGMIGFYAIHCTSSKSFVILTLPQPQEKYVGFSQALNKRIQNYFISIGQELQKEKIYCTIKLDHNTIKKVDHVY